MNIKWQRPLFQPNLPLGSNGQKVTASIAHKELSKNAAKEGMVLLKNNQNLLPFVKGTKLALFGKGSFDYVKGGGGSGDVTVEYVKNLYDGLKELGEYVSIFEDVSDFYRKNVRDQYERNIAPGMTCEPEISEELIKRARAYTDTAIITICRFSGEGWDRKSNYDTDFSVPVDAEVLMKKSEVVFERGDFYLSDAENSMVELVKQYFNKIVVVLNVGGMVDTSWFIEEDSIPSVLMAWQGGMEGGRATAELLCGIGNPSGKLSDTFAKELEDYPSSYNFHESEDYVDYTEDIYVGYRYFETILGAQEKVNYPFGYGLSYTTFAWTQACWEEKDGQIHISVYVTNTGELEGKEVIQVYYSAPYRRLFKAKKSLIAFQKTRLLKPGETQLLHMTFPINDMASYDDLGKVQKSAYVLEAGEYNFYIGNSVRNVKKINESYCVTTTQIVAQYEAKLTPSSLRHRMLADGSYEELPLTAANDPNSSEIERTPREFSDGFAPKVWERLGHHAWLQPYKDGVRPLSEVLEGKMSLDEFVSQMTEEEIARLLGGQPNTGVANTFGFGNLPEYGIPNIMSADGPAGLRILPFCGVCTTAWPCATLLACTWNPEVVYQVGEAGAKEVKENNISVWLTPAINIHRSPLCGRNFEYYSEDPFLTGKMAAAMVKGIQSQHIAATVKHFAFNNKETNRRDSDSRVSERAAREIYLKGFEIIVKEAKPWCIMSAYNMVNGHRTSECKDLIDGILRGEWGFDGLVMTDWWNFGEQYKEVKAGNDVKMATGFPDQLLKAKVAGLITREDMATCAKRVLELIMKID